jgi:DNA (cytosine-5)-methyltransferase 1
VSLPNAFLSPYYSTGVASHVRDPAPTVTTRDRFGLATINGSIDIDDVHFRMLTPAELQAAQTFPGSYRIKGTQREQTRQIGDAVPCVLAHGVADRIADALEGVA